MDEIREGIHRDKTVTAVKRSISKAADTSAQQKILVKCLKLSRNLHSKDRESQCMDTTLFCQPYKKRYIHSLVNLLEKLTGGLVLLNNS